ncbi:MAG: alkyl hydroperoxide reductase and/or thiol-specific antioxidant family (AhpC/TSA) protein [Segetibacter sp.]|nr:alkyl hydroperoxide reductase and/or thiol-specific antioxidant family (AhpC/TSA) protein [Segetibacter sp.]
MKKLMVLAIAALFALQTSAQTFTPIAIGTTIPMAETKMKSINGKEFSIKDAAGKNGVLVMFSCNKCPYVVRYQKRTLEAIESAKANGYGVIIINSNDTQSNDDDSYTAMKEYAQKQGYGNVAYVVDEKSAIANAFGATRTPESFLFNTKGVLVYHGAIDDNHIADQVARKHLQVAMQENKNGKIVSVKKTEFIGCSIKRS